jgi:hypothetical protein
MSQTTDQGRKSAASGQAPKAGKTRASRTPRGGSGLRPAEPSPPKRRRPALTALAVLLIVGGAALAGLLAVRMDSREPVLVVSQQVDAGELITADMLESRNVSGEGLGTIPRDQADEIVDKLYARQTIYPGQLLQTDLLRSTPPLEADQAQVGIPLTSGKYPPGLRSGDAVRLVRIGDAQNPSQALATGLVLEVTKGKSSGFGSDARSSVAAIVVPEGVVDEIVGATGTDELGIALLARGISIGDAQIDDLLGNDR